MSATPDDIYHVVLIPLTQEKLAVVDFDDYAIVKDHAWQAKSSDNGRAFYAVASLPRQKGKKRVFLRMHRIIMNASPDVQVDHRNGDGLCNRRSNLRFCGHVQNMMNSRRHRNKVSSRFKGVFLRSDNKRKWFASIQHNKKRQHLGSFDNEIDAATAYNEAATRLRGEFAHLNVIEDRTIAASGLP
ncbi:MAG: HNH endonuclease [Acidobacteriaceae bacterium]